MEWRSNSHYKKDVKDGTIFTLKNIGVGIVIHKIHGLGDEFYLSCSILGIDDFGLNTEDFDLAVENAKVIIQTKLTSINNHFDKFLSDTSETTIVRY